jgi:hypothetical protein
MMACKESMEACLESKEPTSGEIEPVAVHEEVLKEEVAVKTEEGHWDGHLAVGHSQQLK